MSGGAARARVRSLALLATVATGITTTIAQPFFPQYAQDRFGASATAVGLVAAGCPAAQVVSTPVWTLLMGAVGRRWTLLLGCLVSTAGTVTFALAPLGVRGLLLGRVLMGVGSQGANASSIALIMEVSESLQADMGSLEFVWGLGYMLGPPIGGACFQFSTFALASMPAALLSTLVAVLSLGTICCVPPAAGDAARGRYARVPQHDDGLPDDVLEALEEAAPDEISTPVHAGVRTSFDGWRRLCTLSVLAVCVGIVGHAAAQGFKEISLAKHLRLALNADAGMSGVVFTVEPFVYSIACILVGRLAGGQSQQGKVLVLGLCLYSFGLYSLSVPSVFSNPGGSGIPLSYAGEWVLVLVSLSVMGAASAGILVPALPYMLFSCSARRRDEAAGEATTGGEDVDKELEDSLSGLYAGIWSLGELLGTPVGGYLLDTVPKTVELNCQLKGLPAEGVRPGAGGDAALSCEWGFHTSMQVFAGVMLVCASLMCVDLVRAAASSRSIQAQRALDAQVTAVAGARFAPSCS